MASRIYFYAESLSRQTTTTTDYSVVAVTKTFQPNDSKTYAIFWNVILDGTSTSEFTKARLRNTTASVTYSEYDLAKVSTVTATDKYAVGALALYSSGASPAQQTIEIQVASSAAAQTTGYSEACLLILELDADDVSTSSTGTTTSSSSTYAAKITLSFTPGSAGDYLIITSSDYQNTTGGSDPQYRLNVNSGTFDNILSSAYYQYTGHWHPYTPIARLVNVSGAQTAAVEQASRWNNASVSIRNTYGVALRLDKFDNRYWGEDRTPHNSTSVTFADSATTGAFTPQAVPHMVVAAGISTDNGAAGANATGLKINGAGSDINTNITYNRGQSGYIDNWFSLRTITLAASSQTWKTQYNRAAGTGTVTSDEHVIAVLQLETPASGTSISKMFTSNRIVSQMYDPMRIG